MDAKTRILLVAALLCGGCGDGSESAEPGDGGTDTEFGSDSDTDSVTDPIDETAVIEWNGCTTTVSCTGDDYRTYLFQTDCPLLNDEPPSGQLEVVEIEGQPVVRTSHRSPGRLAVPSTSSRIRSSSCQRRLRAR